MDRYTRHQLKQDEFQDTVEAVQIFVSEHLKAIILSTVAAAVIVTGGLWLKSYYAHQEAAANAELQAAISTFNAPVGTPQPDNPMQPDQVYSSAKAKYQKALGEFGAIVKKHPRTKAAGYAEVHMGLCQARMGNDAVAIKTLRHAAQQSNKEIASLAKFSLAGELLKTGKLDEAAKIFQALANHPTLTVPRTTALMALAGAYSATQPERARQIYLQVRKEVGTNEVIADALKDQLADLPQK